MADALTYELVKSHLDEIQKFKLIKDDSLVITVLGDGRIQKIQYTVDVIASVDNAKSKNFKERRGKFYEVGPTKATITFLTPALNPKKSVKAAIRFKKVSQTQGHIHPNVFVGGQVCWEGMQQMQQAWRDKDITQLVYGTLIFLGSLDSTDTAFHGFQYEELSKKQADLLKGF